MGIVEKYNILEGQARQAKLIYSKGSEEDVGALRFLRRYDDRHNPLVVYQVYRTYHSSTVNVTFHPGEHLIHQICLIGSLDDMEKITWAVNKDIGILLEQAIPIDPFA